MDSNQVKHSLLQLSKEINTIAVEHGFWDESKERNFGEAIALMHSELSEALEALRHKNPPDEHCPSFSNAEVELADCIIRILDFSWGTGLNVPGALLAKMEYNRSRPYKHGKEF